MEEKQESKAETSHKSRRGQRNEDREGGASKDSNPFRHRFKEYARIIDEKVCLAL